MRHVSLTLMALCALLGACSSGTSSTGSDQSSGSTGRGSSGSSTGAGASGASSGSATGARASAGATTGTSAGTTAGSSNAGCLPTPDGGASPYLGVNCTTTDTCCGLVCNQSLNLGTCQPTCAHTADCPLPYTFCDTDAGQCSPAYCGNLSGRGFNEPCNLEDAGDGNCVAGAIISFSGGYLGLCTESGSVASNDVCNPYPLRNDPSGLCVRGDVCTYDTDPNNPVCVQNCDADAGTDAGCPAGKTCQPYWEGGDGFTACL